MKSINTPDLIEANKRSVEAGQNRTLSDEGIEQLDPNGIHVISFEMPHTNYEGTFGFRARILLKMKGTMEPQPLYFDFMPEDYNQLLPLPQLEV